MIDDRYCDTLVQDSWDTIDHEVRQQFLTRQAALTNPSAFADAHSTRRWAPLRPVVLRERSYRLLESVVARVLQLAVESCRRRASTLGELHQALRFPHALPLMDPDGALVTSELTRCARPDILIERGRPRILEFNVGARLGGDTLAPRMAAGFARLVPPAGLHSPPSTVTARSEAMLRALGGQLGADTPGRVAIPTYWTIDHTGTRRYHNRVKKLLLTEVRRMGFEVVQIDLDQLRLDTTGRLLAADTPIDIVLIPWGRDETPQIVDGCGADGNGGLAAVRDADRAGTVELFPRTESSLINSKVVLAWLHEDCDANMLTPTDAALIRNHIPRTTALGLDQSPDLPEERADATVDEHDDVVVKPALGKAGNGVLFKSQTSPRHWRRSTLDAAREAPVVLQQRVQPDRITMTFLDQTSRQQISAQVPFLLSPFMIDGSAADVAVRHMTPDVPAHDVVIAVDRGGSWNTVLLLPNHSTQQLPEPHEQAGSQRLSHAR